MLEKYLFRLFKIDLLLSHLASATTAAPRNTRNIGPVARLDLRLA
jgi:hypothetical protein